MDTGNGAGGFGDPQYGTQGWALWVPHEGKDPFGILLPARGHLRVPPDGEGCPHRPGPCSTPRCSQHPGVPSLAPRGSPSPGVKPFLVLPGTKRSLCALPVADNHQKPYLLRIRRDGASARPLPSLQPGPGGTRGTDGLGG